MLGSLFRETHDGENANVFYSQVLLTRGELLRENLHVFKEA